MEKKESKLIQATNRELCMDWCHSNDMVHSNSWFEKDIEKKITYREISTPETQDDFNWNDYAELDHCFVRKRWRNSIKDLEANRNCT